jgi:hypothetical protein
MEFWSLIDLEFTEQAKLELARRSGISAYQKATTSRPHLYLIALRGIVRIATQINCIEYIENIHSELCT